MTAEQTATLTPAQIRSAARRAKADARAEYDARRLAAIQAAGEALADHYAGVEGALGPCNIAKGLGLVLATDPDLGVRVAELFRAVTVRTSTDARIAKGCWLRQNGKFLRSNAEIKPGTFARGEQGKPKNTAEYVCLFSTESGRLTLESSAEVAATEAIALLATAYTAARRIAGEIAEREEKAAANAD